MKNIHKFMLVFVFGLITLGTSSPVHATATDDAMFRACYNACRAEKVVCEEAAAPACNWNFISCLGGCEI